MKSFILFASLIFASGLLFVNMYTSLVDVKSWSSNIPVSIETARSYFKTTNPGDFFRMFSPVNQLLALLSLILLWKSGKMIRGTAALILLLYVASDIFTFAFFYPRNEFLFEKASLTNIEGLKATLNEWSLANWFRSLLLLVGIVLTYTIMKKTYSISSK